MTPTRISFEKAKEKECRCLEDYNWYKGVNHYHHESCPQAQEELRLFNLWRIEKGVNERKHKSKIPI